MNFVKRIYFDAIIAGACPLLPDGSIVLGGQR
jgi:hypothetical protein